MNLEELWRLFPIVLTEHQKIWKDFFSEEEQKLKEILNMNYIKRISHIGSTAVPVIQAKPIIDILVEVNADEYLYFAENILINNGYICMSKSNDRQSFNKGYTEGGFAEKVFHLHLRFAGDNDELYFRDYLIEYPDIAKQYEKLKIDLSKQFKYNRDEYTIAKTDFVKKYTERARQKYLKKY